MAASFWAFAMVARSGPFLSPPVTPDLVWTLALPLAVDQMDPNTSPPAPPPAVLDADEVLPSDDAVADGCLEVMPEKLWFDEMVLERADLTDRLVVGSLMVDWTDV